MYNVYIVPDISEMVYYIMNQYRLKEGMFMPASKAQQKAVSKYMKANYDEIKVRVPKGQKDTIQAHAAARGESVNGFINRVISEAIEREQAELNETTPEA